MTSIEAATLYAGLLLLLMVYLKGNCGFTRMREKIYLGDGGSDPMLRAIRAQGNAVEDVPVVLIGLFALVGLGVGPVSIHLLGAAFVIARVLHALGMVGGVGWGRVAGTLITQLVMMGTAGLCLWHALT
ncbi:MAG: MAPEG family protein [Pseudomonadota bacterium]